MATLISFSLPQEKKLGKGLGLLVTVGVHALVLLLLLYNPLKLEPPMLMSMSARILSESPADEPEQVELPKPPMVVPKLTVQLPEVEIAPDTRPSPIKATLVESAPPKAKESSKDMVDSLPQFDAHYLNNPAPVYPHLSRRLREAGLVMLRVFVTAEGLPQTVEVERSSGFARLDQAALTAVQRWKFSPAKRAGFAVGAWVMVPLEFSLNN